MALTTNYFGISFAFHCRYGDRENNFGSKFLLGDADVAILCSLERAAQQMKHVSDIIYSSWLIQIKTNIVFE